eukprot:GILI01005396.1.p1 GENE.GILI01005396.1~~GILI01005396.1.p1  ORF type:complete len:390 (-),score=88.93 GILI01005396.1:77-1162(-)
MNMGGEMLYILDQRLKAQNIPSDKSSKVLQDVIRTMFDSRFLGELFKPQPVYSNQSIRQIFDRLAHSSIMRLNESSMDKLYDLMTMGVKHQILCCTYPEQMMQVTLNHLDILKKIVGPSTAFDALEAASVLTMEKYGVFTTGDFCTLRQTILRFFYNRRVKVSVFLADNLQNNDASICIPRNGPVPPLCSVPGTIKFADGSQKSIPVNGASLCEPPVVKHRLRVTDPSCILGYNLYSKDRSPTHSSSASKTASGGQTSSAPAAPAPAPTPSITKEQALGELNLLASLIGSSAPAETFKLNLFPASSSFTSSSSSSSSSMYDIITIDTVSSRATGKDSVQDFDLPESSSSGGDDLLDLMDNA